MPLSRDLPSNAVAESTVRLQFNGNGGEYFGIWLANLALSVITLGIYSPWAKVRRLKYFYQHTTLNDSPFDFHGDPFRILIGRIIALVFFIIYSILTELESPWFFLGFAMVLVCAPFMIQRALRFRLRSTSYRGLRFNFFGSLTDALVKAILIPIISIIPLGLTYPFGLREWRRYQLRNSAYGKTSFGWDSGILPFYLMTLCSILPILLIVAPIAIVTFLGQMARQIKKGAANPMLDVSPAHFGIVLAFGIFIVLAFCLARVASQYFKHRIIYSGLVLGDYKFKSTISFWPCFYVVTINSILNVITLGLFRPFAAIRLARLQLTNIEITGPTDIGTFIGDNVASVSALGTEAIDFFDLDIGL